MMENLKKQPMEYNKSPSIKDITKEKKKQEIMILRWGHRPQRDARLTTHVALTARALGASGFILSDTVDESIKKTIGNINENFGGKFSFEMGISWRKVVKKWKNNDGVVVHLTAYGENIQNSNVLDRLRETSKDILVIVGSQKVPGDFFSEQVSDFNIAVGNQPHSECAALAIFLDRFFRGETLGKTFDDAKKIIIPQKRGKKVD